MTSVALTPELIRRAPKVLLHEHLDGGLRPETVIELAREVDYRALPTQDPEELRRWFVADASGGDLVRYLEGFAHTTALMQTREQIERVAAESAIDLARDGVVYAEVRFAPEQHLDARADAARGRARGTRRLRARRQGGDERRSPHCRAHDPVGHAPGGVE